MNENMCHIKINKCKITKKSRNKHTFEYIYNKLRHQVSKIKSKFTKYTKFESLFSHGPPDRSSCLLHTESKGQVRSSLDHGTPPRTGEGASCTWWPPIAGSQWPPPGRRAELFCEPRSSQIPAVYLFIYLKIYFYWVAQSEINSVFHVAQFIKIQTG